MDERALLLLGILRAQSQHGYQINEFIERNLSRVTDMKKPTAYAILDRLSRDGYVRMRTEQEGNRPPRKVYSITTKGEQAFEDLLRETLARSDRFSAPGDIGLMFLAHLSRAEAITLLEQRQADLAQQRASYERAPRQDYDLGARLAIERILQHMETERTWLSDAIAMLRDAPERVPDKAPDKTTGKTSPADTRHA
jgi:DNA-binding PadR family transcriptional regulator